MSRITAPLADLYSSIRSDLREVERVFDKELVSDYRFVDDLCDRVRAYRGKMLRPALLLLAGKTCGCVSSNHHTLAAVIEMVHVATLVHDDVLDEADERRGQAPINSVEGNVAAVLLGDYLISHAYHLCSSLEDQTAARLIGATTNAVCEGELLQNRHRGDAGLSESTYFEIIERKTGALTATACELGALYAGADAEAVASLRSFGLAVGVAFQIVDDLLDIRGDRQEVGKSLGLDFSDGKLTLPTIHCLANAGPETAAALRSAVLGETTTGRDRLRRWLTETDSLGYASSVALEYISRARSALEILPPSDARSSLTAMAEFIIQRRL
ncbi:MAG: polyprenyl synthetase family protein [Planctomycetes bacterium]|nr:polyprenyl synthetase family protein [Planctomycetota bacterium]